MLSAKQKKCIDLLVTGRYTQAQIAKELKITPQTICNWKKDPDFSQELQACLKSCIQTLAPKAVKTLESLLNSESDNVRFSAARDILDRTGFKPGENISVTSNLEAEQSKLDKILAQLYEYKKRPPHLQQRNSLDTVFIILYQGAAVNVQ